MVKFPKGKTFNKTKEENYTRLLLIKKMDYKKYVNSFNELNTLNNDTGLKIVLIQFIWFYTRKFSMDWMQLFLVILKMYNGFESTQRRMQILNYHNFHKV